MDGYQGRDYYTKQEFNDGCQFNLWMGAGIGVVFSVSAFLLYAWVHNWF